MSAARLANHMRLQAAMNAGTLGRPKHGLVTSYDLNNYLVKVQIQPENFETGWIPICTLMAGNGFGIYFGPSQNDQAVVLFQDGDWDSGFCIGFLPSDVDQPPSVPSGEIHVVHKAGSSLIFTNDGKVALSTASDLNVTVAGALNATVTGKATLSASEFDLTGALKVTGHINSSGPITAATAFVQGTTPLTVP